MASGEERLGRDRLARLFVCEFITGGGCHGADLPAALAAEGAMMRDAVLRDLLALERHAITITGDSRLAAPTVAVDLRTVDGDPWVCWRRCMEASDLALVIAPESEGILERMNRMVVESGAVLLGCEPSAVAVTASKLATARRLAACGIAVAPTAMPGEGLPAGAHGWVVKPDDGAGSEATFLVESPATVANWHAEDPTKPLVVQAFVPGEPLSLSVLYTADEVILLGVNAQIVDCDSGRLRQTGVIVNGCADRRARMQALAESVGRAVPGLRGYVGIDLIDTGTDAVIIEVNPRLTTAYAGLQASLGCNPAALLLAAFVDRPVAAPDLSRAKPIRVDMK